MYQPGKWAVNTSASYGLALIGMMILTLMIGVTSALGEGSLIGSFQPDPGDKSYIDLSKFSEKSIEEQVQEARKAMEIPLKDQPVEKVADMVVNVPLSTFEAYVRDQVAPEISSRINQFGYDIFNRVPSTFAPAGLAPVVPNYLMGPGDQVMINVWGMVNAVYSPVIDRDGKIILPQLGVMQLAGMTFTEAKDHIEREFGRNYKKSQVKIDVSMGRLRTIRIFIMGNVRQPGSYSLSSQSTVINGLFAAGGPTKIGSMRNILVSRDGKSVATLDLYDLLLKGDKSTDIRLMPEDVIFVPPTGPQVGIMGYVKTPAIFEVKGEVTLQNLLDLAGGFSDIAFRGRAQVHRIAGGNKQTLVEYDLNLTSAEKIPVYPGDVITVFPTVPDRRVVRLFGAVQREGEYGFVDGMTVKELINLAGGLKYYAYREEAELFRVSPTDEGPQTERINLSIGEAMKDNKEHDLVLRPDDYLMVKAVPEWELYRRVAVIGEVKFPGIYTIREGEQVSTLLERSVVTDNAYLKGTIFVRESVRKLQQMQLTESIDRLEQQVLSKSSTDLETAISTEAVMQEQVAMGQKRALISKLRAVRAKGRLAINFTLFEDPEAFEKSEMDINLEQGDIIYIPPRPAQVQVLGAVFNQNAFVYHADGDLESYLEKAGGMTKEAEKKDLYVLKVDGTAISKRQNSNIEDQILDPGDTIVVPEKLDKAAWLRNVKDITQILYQIAVTAGVLIVAF